MLGESAYQLAQLSDIKNITAASSSILRIFLDSAYEPICAAAHIGSVTAGTPIGVAQRFLQKRPYDPDGAPLEQKTLSKRAHVVGRWREIRNC